MAHHGFTQRQGYMYRHDLEGGATYHQKHRQQLFTRTELALLIPLTTLATGLGSFTVAYIVHQRNSIQPAAIAALGGTSLLLIVVVFLVFQRLRRPASSRIAGPRAEKTTWQTWANAPASRPVAVSYHRMVQETTEPGELYATVPITKPPSPTPSTFTSRLRLALQNSVGAGFASRGSFDSQSSSTANEDRELLLLPDSGRSSVESSDAARGHGLWHSIFELPADAKLEKLRQKNLKRLSKESRWSMQEMGDSDRPVSRADGSPDFQIVVTRPQATASRLGDYLRSSTPSSSEVSLRETSLAFDPLRANPVQLKRDPSMRQTRSSHDLGGLCKSNTRAPAAQRPRSAEPGLDRCALGYGLPDPSPQREIPSVIRPKPVSPPTLEHERRPAPREAPAAIRSMPVSPLTPKQELKAYSALREATATVSPVSPLSFAERMAQRERGRRRAASPSLGTARDAQDLRVAYMNRN
jgi:hypothetical protein